MRFLYASILFFTASFGFSQELIINGSFENFIGTPSNNDNLETTEGWYFLDGFPEYYNLEYNNSIGLRPFDGKGYVSMGLWLPNDWGNDQVDAIGTKLNVPLRKGEKYILSFYAQNNNIFPRYPQDCSKLQVYGLYVTPPRYKFYHPSDEQYDISQINEKELLAETETIKTGDYVRYRFCIEPTEDIPFLAFHNASEIRGCDGGVVGDYINFDKVSLVKEETFEVLGADTLICEGQTVTLDANFQNGIITWENGQSDPIRVISDDGLYSVEIEIQGKICPIEDSIRISYNPIKVLAFTLGNDTTVCSKSDFRIGYESPGLIYSWSSGESTPFISPAKSGTYVLTTSNGSCDESASIDLEVQNCKECSFFLPNSFSPNDDGINDIWLPYSQCNLESYRLVIFDRWGNLVFETKDLTQGWNGTAKAKLLESGVYVFIIEFDVEEFGKLKTKHVSGDINILR